MEETNNKEIIDLGKLIKKVWSRRSLFYKVWPITFLAASLLIVCVPRTYTAEAKFAPEMGGSMDGGALSSIASSFGFDIGNMQTSDAINPMLYPDLMEDNGFVTSLFNIRVKDSEGEIDTDYYTYLRKYQKQAWWSEAMSWVKGLFKSKEETKVGGDSVAFDPYNLSKTDNNVAEAIRASVRFSIDKKTGVIGITVSAQDKLICKLVADSVSEHLQQFITEYRTNKARVDFEHYKQLVDEARQSYEEAQKRYAAYADANTNVILKTVLSKVEQLENDMSLKFNAYSTMNAQLEAARAKVQERTPAFTKLKGASVPRKASGPKRMFFVLGMLILATFGGIFYIIKDDIKDSMLK